MSKVSDRNDSIKQHTPPRPKNLVINTEVNENDQRDSNLESVYRVDIENIDRDNNQEQDTRNHEMVAELNSKSLYIFNPKMIESVNTTVK